MKTIFAISLLCLFTTAQSQEALTPRWDHTGSFQRSSPNYPQQNTPPGNVVKHPGHYTKADWRKLIDSVWGPGLPTADKLVVFDYFWNTVDQKWGGFANLEVNWDSLKSVYRAEVAAGVSRGRFAGILGRLTIALQEHHTTMYDLGLDSTYISFGGYKPGAPLFNMHPRPLGQFLGAQLTPLPDSSLLVCLAPENHPINLKAGDIVLGYDHTPWKVLVKELLDAELPMYSGPMQSGGGIKGSSKESFTHICLMSAGDNWGLFDTIDVVKYSTKDTVHLPTSLLNALHDQPWFFATEQLPVKGVSMPAYASDNSIFVSWGVVDGTSIGYIYAWDWGAGGGEKTSTLFTQAVDDLMHKKKVDGLILDLRMNLGGQPEYANGGYSQLFNFDPTNNYSQAVRNNPADHFSYTLVPPRAEEPFVPTPEIFDRPIAVLSGPICLSAGDYNLFRIRFHPMARIFGKKSNGAFVAFANRDGGTLKGFSYRVDHGQIYSNYKDEGYLLHKTFPVDEEVWLTKEGVAKGEDDVVKRAMEWITTLTHAHGAALDRLLYRPGLDSISLKLILSNSLHHTSTMSAILTDVNSIVRDSVVLYNDGLHGDGIAGDSVWGLRILAPADENIFAVSVRTADITDGSYRRLPNVQHFTTAGPLKLDNIVVTKFLSSYRAKPYLRNNGKTFTIKGAAVRLRSNDSWITGIIPETIALPDLLPGAAVATGTSFTIGYNAATFPGHFNLIAEMSVGGIVYWTDSSRVVLTNVKDEETLPTEYSVAQNFPNPFNPSTDINYQIPKQSLVTLKIFDLLGREVAMLVNERKDAGRYSVQWDATRCSSGVYFYMLQAGEYRNTKRMLLLK
jgi:hypothetical protein